MYLKSLIRLSIFVFVLFLFSFSYKQRQSSDLKQSMDRGKELYMSYCLTCHMQNGEGIPGSFPPLANADYLMEDAERSISQIINGASGEMKVNGVVYNNVMPGFDMTDREVADVLNYIRNSWGNRGEMITQEQVHEVRDK